MKQPSATDWSLQDSLNHYQFPRWGEGFFGLSSQGHVEAYPRRDVDAGIDLMQVVRRLEQQQLHAPVLLRFPQIAQQRIDDLHSAFARAIDEYQYANSYRCIYPVKVSPHRHVVKTVLEDASGCHQGLEAGSKAELLSIIAASQNSTPILCNGFKDEQYIEMALRAVSLGRDVTIVIEKPSEFPLIRDGIERLGVRPKLGVRIKLATKGVGHWEATGGTKSKFGLTISELLRGLDQLERWSLLDKLDVIHFHLGSQITQIRSLKNAVIEATRIYADLVKRGMPLTTIDVGGGLGIDYCGQRMDSVSSINYTWQEYANDVVYHIQTVCDQMSVAHPRIYSESGRALVAHHSVLVLPVMGSYDSRSEHEVVPISTGANDDSAPVQDLNETLSCLKHSNLLESYHDAEQAMEMAGNLFRHGHLSLHQRGEAERLFHAICRRIHDQMFELSFLPEDLKELNERLAVNQFGNFSVFRSVPDHWAIDQVFPIAPIHRHTERPTQRSVLSDITCDSDGRIRRFVSAGDSSTSILLHPSDDTTYYLGIFLVGAYQEVMGDLHNLFGRVHVAHVERNGDAISITSRPGESMIDVLENVGYTGADLMEAMQQSIVQAEREGRIDASQRTAIESFYETAAREYTYLNATTNDVNESTIAAPKGNGSVKLATAKLVSGPS